jgi:hypothetical protein
LTPADLLAISRARETSTQSEEDLRRAITGQVAGDGRSDWLRGVQLLAVYLILALVYLYVPEEAVR